MAKTETSPQQEIVAPFIDYVGAKEIRETLDFAALASHPETAAKTPELQSVIALIKDRQEEAAQETGPNTDASSETPPLAELQARSLQVAQELKKTEPKPKSFTQFTEQIINLLPKKLFKRSSLATILAVTTFAAHNVLEASGNKQQNQDTTPLIKPVSAETIGTDNLEFDAAELPLKAQVVNEDQTKSSESAPSTAIEEMAETFDAAALVNQFIIDEKFPKNLTREQNAAFIQALNDRRGPQPIWTDKVRDAAGNPGIYYYDVAANKMKILLGSYEDHKAIIEQNYLPLYVEVYTEEGTGNLQFVHPTSKELITVPNSANFDWDTIITADNYYQSLADGTLNLSGADQDSFVEFVVVGYDKMQTEESKKYKTNLVPAILMDQQSIELAESQGRYFPYYCLKMLIIKTDENGQPTHGIITLIGSVLMKLVQENGAKETDLILLTAQGKTEELKDKAGQIFYVSISTKQDKMWANNERSSIDQFKNIAPTVTAYDQAVEKNVPQSGNIILTSQLIIER